MDAVRAKFRCDSVTQYMDHRKKVELYPVTSGSEENKRFFASTPTGKIEMYITTEAALMFTPGKEYYIDFTPAIEAAK